MFCNSETISVFRDMITVKQFAEKRGVPLQTVYSWIYRDKTTENGFKVVQIGSIKMIQETKAKV